MHALHCLPATLHTAYLLSYLNPLCMLLPLVLLLLLLLLLQATFWTRV
jgi:hypothetical protein